MIVNTLNCKNLVKHMPEHSEKSWMKKDALNQHFHTLHITILLSNLCFLPDSIDIPQYNNLSQHIKCQGNNGNVRNKTRNTKT